MGDLDVAVQDASYWRREFLQRCGAYEQSRRGVRAPVEAHATRFADDTNRAPHIRQAGSDVLVELHRFDLISISLQSAVGAAAFAAQQAASHEFLERFDALLVGSTATDVSALGSPASYETFVTTQARAVSDLFETATVLIIVHAEVLTAFNANHVGVSLSRVVEAAIEDLKDRGRAAALDWLKAVAKQLAGPLVPILTIAIAVDKVITRAEELVYRPAGPEDALSFFWKDIHDLNDIIEQFVHDLDNEGGTITP